jgi:putative tryptophan/tyrosine transport system permease protein
VLILAGTAPLPATLLALAAGMLAGLATAFIHLRFRINTLLAGILVMTILYSVNLRVLGRANVALLGTDSVFTQEMVTSVPLQIAVFAALAAALLAALLWLTHTEIGLSARAVGANAALAPALGINPWTFVLGGLALANGLSALAGALAVQLQGFADVHMGFGVLINGLAALIIGETLIGLGLKPADLKLATGLFVLVTLALPALRRGAEPERLRE